MDSAIVFPNNHLIGSDLVGKYRYPKFEQPGPEYHTRRDSLEIRGTPLPSTERNEEPNNNMAKKLLLRNY